LPRMSLFFATYLILFLKQPSHSFYKSLKFYFFTEPKNHTLSWMAYGKAFLCFENAAKEWVNTYCLTGP